MEHLLALDWGAQKVGVALADCETRIAFACATIAREELEDALRELVAEHNVARIIVGVTDASNQEHYYKIVNFATEVSLITDIVPQLVSEHGSTREAQTNRKAAGKKNIAADDAEAARVLLQGWLDVDGDKSYV